MPFRKSTCYGSEQRRGKQKGGGGIGYRWVSCSTFLLLGSTSARCVCACLDCKQRDGSTGLCTHMAAPRVSYSRRGSAHKKIRCNHRARKARHLFAALKKNDGVRSSVSSACTDKVLGVNQNDFCSSTWRDKIPHELVVAKAGI